MQRPPLRGTIARRGYPSESPRPVYILDFLGYEDAATAIAVDRETGKLYEAVLGDVTLDIPALCGDEGCEHYKIEHVHK